MTALTEASITPHAIQRFQERIARVSADQAEAIIRAGLAAPFSVTAKTLPRGDASLTVRVRRLTVAGLRAPANFRLTVTPGTPPVVVTTLYGTSGGSRGVGRPRRTVPVLR